MSRVLLISMGVPALVPARRHAGPGLRAAHFFSALRAQGHEVLLLAVLDKGEPVPVQAGTPLVPGEASPVRSAAATIEFTTEEELLSRSMLARIERFSPDAVVGVTAYAAALASRLKLDVPLWADVFGDLMAEAQAKALRSGSDWSLVHFWTLMRAVLERGDRFSAVSVAQSHALVGQLGLAGRLSQRTAGDDLVATIPCAAEVPEAAADSGPARRRMRRELGIAEEDLVLLASGGVNTWSDVETLAGAVASAMQTNPRLHLMVTGGAIPGHDEKSHADLLKMLGHLDPARVHLLGWVDCASLPLVYAAADLGLHIERPLYERRLGAENRVIEWLAHGLPCVTTAQSETGEALVAAGLAIGCRPGDGEGLAGVLLRSDGAWRERASRQGREWVAQHRGFSATAAPLLAWCASPTFARDHDGARLVRLGLLSHPETSAEMLEAYVAALPVRELGRRGLRWMARRCAAAVSRLFTRGHQTRAVSKGARSRRPAGLLAVLLSVTTLLGGCNENGSPRPAERPNILLLSIDTLRADHLGSYGYQVSPSPSPWMDRLGAGAVVVEKAVTSAPETAPALATLITGLYQDRHGVMFNRAKLGVHNHTLAERLKEVGYSTAAFVGNWLVDSDHGFGQGFDRFEVVQVGGPGNATIDDKLVARMGEFLRNPPGNKPWMAWVHMMDPHGPYSSASKWWSRDLDYSRVSESGDAEVPISKTNFGLGVIPAYQQIEGLTRLSQYSHRYDGDIRFSDSQVGSLLGMLAATGMADHTIVVLVADHGESLVEHDELLQHGWFVYDPTVRVPLMVSWPGVISAGGRLTKPVCSVDIAPTILDLAGVKSEGGGFDGKSFAADLGAGVASGSVSPAPGEVSGLRDAGCYSIGPRANHPFALSTASHKLILTPAGSPTDPSAHNGDVSDQPERIELYDLVTDPGETTDLARAHPELVDELQSPLARLRARFRANGWRW